MTIACFLLDAFADWEIGYILPALKRVLPVTVVGLDTRPVRSLGGLTVIPDVGVKNLDLTQISALILPGGDSWESADTAALDPVITKLFSRRVPIAAICAATGYLAKRGVLNELHHTSNSMEYLAAQSPSYSGQSHYIVADAVRDGGVITAPGTRPLEFACQILEELRAYDARLTDAWFGLFKHNIPMMPRA